jgi:hypothetical protein
LIFITILCGGFQVIIDFIAGITLLNEMSLRKIAIIISLGAALAILIEGGAYLTATSLQKKGIFYAPHVTETYQVFQARFNPLLGWPSEKNYGSGDYDRSGSRVVPAFPDPDRFRACVSLYGDSFTWGEEVDNEHAWGNVLSKLLACRVANYGVGGYGTDQAYLRFHYNVRDHAKITLLVHLSENITRNVGQFRNLAVPVPQFLLKPRFILDGQGQLELVPMPVLSEKDYVEVNRNPEKYFKHDFFVPGGLSGNQKMSLSYSFAILRAFKRFHIRNKFTGEPNYANYYRADHPAHGLQVTAAIIQRFYREALSRGQEPIVAILPTGYDLVYYHKSRRWVYQPLMDDLRQSGINALNIGQEMMSRLGDRNPCALYTRCEGHLNEAGNEMVAEIIFRYLKSHVSPNH